MLSGPHAFQAGSNVSNGASGVSVLALSIQQEPSTPAQSSQQVAKQGKISQTIPEEKVAVGDERLCDCLYSSDLQHGRFHIDEVSLSLIHI